jgi:hypothetical protein
MLNKEFFKQMREKIDVLTLTATPYPRTCIWRYPVSGILPMINTAHRSPTGHHPVGGYDRNWYGVPSWRTGPRRQVFFDITVWQTSTVCRTTAFHRDEARIAVDTRADACTTACQRDAPITSSTRCVAIFSDHRIGAGIPKPILSRGFAGYLWAGTALRCAAGWGAVRSGLCLFSSSNTKRNTTVEGWKGWR